MPCYRTQLMSVELKAADRDLLEQAIKSLGWGYQTQKSKEVFYCDNGIIVYADSVDVPISRQAHVNALKRQYSIEVVKAKAKAKGWTATWQTTKTGAKAALKKW